MEKAGITTGKFIAGIVIAILASSAISAAISTQLLIAGPQGPQGATGPAGPAGPQGPSGGLYAPNYDSGWVDISNKAGKYFNITHNLNSADVIVDIRGRTTAGDGANQRYLGLTGNIPGWTKIYGGTGDDYANSVVQTGDGGYALAGGTWSYGAGVEDFWLVKTDFAGNQLWNKTYGGAGYDECLSMVQTLDGGYALAGDTDSFGAGLIDFWLVKTDSAGAAQWNKTYGGTGYDGIYSLLQTPDEGYALAGDTDSFGAGGSDFWLVKTDSAGSQQWIRIYGGTGDDYANSVVQTGDGGFALAGYTDSFGAGNGDFWLAKTDVESGLAWTDSTANTITLYRGATDIYWNYVRVRIWKID